MHYKSPDNSQTSGYKLHCIEPEYAYMLPAGCVQITDEEADQISQSLITVQSIDSILPKYKELRELVLNRLAGIALAAQLEGDTAITSAYLVARQKLLDITKNLPANVDDAIAELNSRYYDIVANLYITAPSMVSAFTELDQ